MRISICSGCMVDASHASGISISRFALLTVKDILGEYHLGTERGPFFLYRDRLLESTFIGVRAFGRLWYARFSR